MTWNIFTLTKRDHQNGVNPIDFDTDNLRIGIVTNSQTIAQNTDDFWDDYSGNEVTGTNYTSMGAAGGIALAGLTVSVNGSTVEFDANDLAPAVAQNAGGFTNGRTLVLVKWDTNAASSPVIAYHTEGSDFGNVAGDLDITFPVAGIINW